MTLVCSHKPIENNRLGIPEPSAPDAWVVNGSFWGSQGQRPGPGVQGARSPLAAARVGQLHFAQKKVHSNTWEAKLPCRRPRRATALCSKEPLFEDKRGESRMNPQIYD